MENNTVYLVETSKGDYESTQYILVGVYSTQQEAEKAKEEYVKELFTIKNKYSEQVSEQYRKESEDIMFSDRDRELPLHLEEWWNWYYRTEPHNYSTAVYITPIQLNTRQYKIGE